MDCGLPGSSVHGILQARILEGVPMPSSRIKPESPALQAVSLLLSHWGSPKIDISNLFLLLFSHSVVLDSLKPHGLQHATLPCPSLSPGVCSNSCPLSQWCHLTISFSVACFSSCPQSFLASRSFPMSQLFISGGQSIGASASASVLPMNIQDWFPLRMTSLISLLSKGISSLLQHHSSKTLILWRSAFFSNLKK